MNKFAFACLPPYMQITWKTKASSNVFSYKILGDPRIISFLDDGRKSKNDVLFNDAFLFITYFTFDPYVNAFVKCKNGKPRRNFSI